MARAKTTPKRQPLVMRSLTLTHDANETLQRLSQNASDSLGWTVSSSAIVRALLQYAEQQPSSWAQSHLFPFVEREITSGMVWGKKK